MEDLGDRWCILRTSGGRTLPLAKSLAAVGFDVWTPIEVRTRQKPRTKVKVEHDAPILPTFVFVRADRLLDLAGILALPMSPHPSFSIFRYAGRVPLIADREIDSLHAAENRAHQRHVSTKRHTIPVGQGVKMEDGPFAGMSGVVMSSNGKEATVRFSLFGMMNEVKIASWLLMPEHVERPSSIKGRAARAA